MSTVDWFGSPTQAELEYESALIWPPIDATPLPSELRQRALKHVYAQAKFDGECRKCGKAYKAGTTIFRLNRQWVCEQCAGSAA